MHTLMSAQAPGAEGMEPDASALEATDPSQGPWPPTIAFNLPLPPPLSKQQPHVALGEMGGLCPPLVTQGLLLLACCPQGPGWVPPCSAKPCALSFNPSCLVCVCLPRVPLLTRGFDLGRVPPG